MTFSVFNMRGVSMLQLEHGKVATPRVAAVRSRRAKLVVQARYSYDEDEAPARRASRPSRGWDDDSSQGYEQRRGGGGGGGSGGRGYGNNYQSWDPDFDAPSRMDRSSRDGGYRDGGSRYPREGGSGYGGNRGAGERGGYGNDRGGYGGGNRGGGSGGGRGYSRGPPRDYEGTGEGEQRGGDERRGGSGRGGRRGYSGAGDRGYGGDRAGGDRGERRGFLTEEQRQERLACNQIIRDATNWRELAAFVEEKGSVMDAEHVTTILAKLSGRYFATGGRQQQGGGGRGSYGRDQAIEFTRPRDEASSAEYDRLLSTLLGWVLVLMPTFRARQVVGTLQSLSKLELWNVEVITALVGHCVKSMVQFEPMDYANILMAFAKFNYPPGQEFVDAFLANSPRKMSSMYPTDISKIGLAMSKLGIAPTAAWAEAFWKESAAKFGEMARFGDLPVGDTLMAAAYFAQSGQQPPQEWVDKIFGSFVETEQERQARQAAQQKEYQQQLDTHNRQALTAKEDAKIEAPPPKPVLADRPLPRVTVINKMLYTLSNLSHKPSPAWFAAVVDAWRRQLQYCSPSDLGNIALYLGRYLAVPVPSNVCAYLVKEVTRGPQSGKHRGDDLAAIAYLLSASQYKGGEKEIDDFVCMIKPRLGECSISSLELIYNALPTLGKGYRLNETVTEAANRYNDLAAQQAAEQGQQQGGAAVQVEESEPVVAGA